MIAGESRVIALEQRHSHRDLQGDPNMHTRIWAVMVGGVAIWWALGVLSPLWATPARGNPTPLSCAEIKAIAKPLLEPAAYAELSQLSSQECEAGVAYLTPGKLAYLFRFGTYEPHWERILEDPHAGPSSLWKNRIAGRAHEHAGWHMHVYAHTHGNDPERIKAGLIIGVARLLLMIIGTISLLSLPVLTLIGLLLYRRFIMA